MISYDYDNLSRIVDTPTLYVYRLLISGSCQQFKCARVEAPAAWRRGPRLTAPTTKTVREEKVSERESRRAGVYYYIVGDLHLDAGRLGQDMGQGFEGLGEGFHVGGPRGQGSSRSARHDRRLLLRRPRLRLYAPPSRRRRPGDAARDSRDQPQRL